MMRSCRSPGTVPGPSGRRSRISCGGRSGRERSRPTPASPRPGISPVSSGFPSRGGGRILAAGRRGLPGLRQGARPKVSEAAVPREADSPRGPAAPPCPAVRLRPRAPDVSSIPRAVWLRSLREALAGSATPTSSTATRAGSRRLRLDTRRIPRPGSRRRRGSGAGRRHLRLLAGAGDRLPGARRSRREEDRFGPCQGPPTLLLGYAQIPRPPSARVCVSSARSSAKRSSRPTLARAGSSIQGVVGVRSEMLAHSAREGRTRLHRAPTPALQERERGAPAAGLVKLGLALVRSCSARRRSPGTAAAPPVPSRTAGAGAGRDAPGEAPRPRR